MPIEGLITINSATVGNWNSGTPFTLRLLRRAAGQLAQTDENTFFYSVRLGPYSQPV